MHRNAVDRLIDRGDRRPRADALRNVERLVEAAREALADEGSGVAAHEIARRAGVGIGTLYRRVSSREELIEAVLLEMVAEADRQADEALADDDPWEGFCAFAQTFVQLCAASRGLFEAGSDKGSTLARALFDLRARIAALVKRAQAAGQMRTDVAWEDIPFFLSAVITPPAAMGLRAGKEQWLRNLQVVLDGLGTSHQTPVPADSPRAEAL